MVGKIESHTSVDSDFYEIVKKAYEKGREDEEMTIEKMFDSLKADLLKLKGYSI